MLANGNLRCIFYLFCPFVLHCPSGAPCLQTISVPFSYPESWSSAGKEKVLTNNSFIRRIHVSWVKLTNLHVSKHIFLFLQNSCSLWKRTLEDDFIPPEIILPPMQTHTQSQLLTAGLWFSALQQSPSCLCVCVCIILRWLQTSCSQAYSDPPKHSMHDLSRQYFSSSSVLRLNQWAPLACDSDHPTGQPLEMSLSIICWLLTLFPLGLLQGTPWQVDKQGREWVTEEHFTRNEKSQALYIWAPHLSWEVWCAACPGLRTQGKHDPQVSEESQSQNG